MVADSVYCSDYDQVGEEKELTIFSGGDGNLTNFIAAAFYNLNRSDHEPSWKVGDGYAMEFAELQLPEGYVFGGGEPPKKAGEIAEFAAVRFDPDSASSETVEIHVTRPDADGRPKPVRKAGQAYADNDKSV